MQAKAVGYRIAQWVSERIPASWALWIAQRLADGQWRRDAARRAGVRANLSLLLGESIAPSDPRIRDVFRNFARYLVEFLTIHRVSSPVVRAEGAEHLREAQRHRRGIIVLTAHLGNWEVGAVLLQRMGWPMAAVALPHEEAGTNALFDAQRRRCGIEVLPLARGVTQQCLQRLRRGEALGLLGDLDFIGEGVEVPFCGRQVRLPRGPALLSVRSQAPVVPVFCIREGNWSFRLCLEPPILPPRHPDHESVTQLTAAYAAVLERYVTRTPEQWLVFRPLATITGTWQNAHQIPTAATVS